MTDPIEQDVAEIVAGLEAIRDKWIRNNSEGDDYEEGYDDGLKACHDIAVKALSAYLRTQGEQP